MKQQKIRATIITLIIGMALIFSNVQSVFAQALTGEIEIIATVQSIDLEAGSIVVVTESGEVYNVVPEVGFDLTTLEEGSVIEIQGTLNEDGSISAVQSVVEIPEVIDPVDDLSTSHYCIQSEDQQPFGAKLAERYETDYATLQSWFCDGAGWGQIMLALETSKITGKNAEEFLTSRSEGLGWGQIWHDLELIDRPEDAGMVKEKEKVGKPEASGKPEKNNENGNSGPPQGKGPKSNRP